MFNLRVRVRDISAGGVATESAMPFTVGSRHLLKFTTGSGAEVVLTATVVRGMGASAGPRRVFLTGFEFAAESPRAAADIQRLLDAVKADRK